MFFPEVAFGAAQDAYPDMIQHGQQASIARSSIWDEGLTPEGATRRKTGGGTPINTSRNQGITGIPVSVKVLVRSESEDEHDGDDEESD